MMRVQLILGGAALQRCRNCIVLTAAVQFAEKLRLLHEREGHEFTRAIKSMKICRALAPEVCFSPRSTSFSTASLAAELEVQK
jgi:hypothetical protein